MKGIVVVLVCLSIVLASDQALSAETEKAPMVNGEQSHRGVSMEALIESTMEGGQLRPGLVDFRDMHITWGPGGKFLYAGLPGREKGFFRIDVASAEITHLALGNFPKLSHDGSLLAFKGSNGAVQIARITDIGHLDDLVVLPTTGVQESGDFAWAPDGNKLAYIHRVVTTGTSGEITRDTEIRVYDVDSKSDRLAYELQIDSGCHERPRCYSNVSVHKLAYAANNQIYFSRGEGNMLDDRSVSVVYVDEGSREATVLSKNIGNYVFRGSTALSPDGRYIATHYSPDPDFLSMAIMVQKAIIDTQTGKRTVIGNAPLPMANIKAMEWSKDSKRVSYVCKRGAISNTICSVAADDGSVELHQLEDTARIGSFSISPDGERLAWISWDMTDTIRIRIAEGDGSNARTVYQTSRMDLENISLGEVQKIQWKSFDGLEFEGLLVLPAGYKSGDRVPLIVNVHGGATGGVRTSGALLVTSPLEFQMWAAKGYAVFSTDYRKGQAVGQNWSYFRRPEGMIRHEPDALDVIAGVNHVIDLGVADPERIALIGHSYGATVINTLLTVTSKFAAAISKEGGTDIRLAPGYVAPKEQRSNYLTLLYLLNATPSNLNSLVEKSSPVLRADKVKTPLLLVMAGNGEMFLERQRARTNEFVTAINGSGGFAESLFFGDDSHIMRKGANVRVLATKSVDWIDFWLKDYEDPNPAKVKQYQQWRKYRDERKDHEVASDDGARSFQSGTEQAKKGIQNTQQN